MSLLAQSEAQSVLDSVFKEAGRLRKGNNLQYHCPFCHHRKRKMEVCLDTHEWHCWVCNKKGRTFHGLLRMMKAPQSAILRLSKVYPDESVGKNWTTSQSSEGGPTKILSLPDEFISLLDGRDTIAHRHAIRYAKARNITRGDIIRYNIGYCESGEYQDRLIFPSYDGNNQLNFFTGRSYKSNALLKYRNPDADRNIIGFENMIDFRYPVSLCEGPLDAITGIKRNVVPLFGKFPSERLWTVLASNLVSEVFIVLDNDALKEAIKISEQLLSYGKAVRLVDLKGKDPNELGFIETTRQMRETPILDFSQLMRLKLKL